MVFPRFHYISKDFWYFHGFHRISMDFMVFLRIFWYFHGHACHGSFNLMKLVGHVRRAGLLTCRLAGKMVNCWVSREPLLASAPWTWSAESLHSFTQPCTYLSMHPLSFYPSFFLSIHTSTIHPSIYLFVCLHILISFIHMSLSIHVCALSTLMRL